MNETTLITGASSGIGLHLAHQFAEHGHPLVLVAPVEAELEAVAAELRASYGVEVRIKAADLEKPEAAQEMFEFATSGGQIDILVNDAGHGQKGNFWEVPIERHLSIVRLNVEAVLKLTRLFLPPLIERKKGRVLNVASIAGFMPGPKVAVYHASKAFILSFTEALAHEVAETGVSVSALCPGPTDTDFFPKADMTEIRGFQQASVMAPQDVAKAGYEGLMAGDRTIVPGSANKALVFSARFLSQEAQSKLNDKMYEDVPPEKHQRNRGDMELEEARQ